MCPGRSGKRSLGCFLPPWAILRTIEPYQPTGPTLPERPTRLMPVPQTERRSESDPGAHRTSTSDPARAHRLLWILGGFRLFLATFLLMCAMLRWSALPLTESAAARLAIEAQAYLIWGLFLAGLHVLSRNRLLAFETALGAGGDLIFMAVLSLSNLHAPWLPIVNIMLIPLGVAASILSLESGLSLAALASLFVIAGAIESWITGHGTRLLPHAAFVAILFFVVTIVLYSLSNRVRISERILARQKLDLENLSQLNAYLVEHMVTGIVVFDPDDRVRFFNEAAERLLTAGGGAQAVPPAAQDTLRFVRESLASPTAHPFQSTPIKTPAGKSVLPQLRPIGQQGALLILDDLTYLNEQMHELKLQAMGRLTASIAHEIRNPLSAIRHAMQLLREFPGLGAEERRLNQIALDQVERLNRVIGNILTLSRPPSHPAISLELNSWLDTFIDEFASHHEITLPSRQIRVFAIAEPLRAQISPELLHQIIWNLAENAFLHGAPSADPVHPRILFRLDRHQETQAVRMGVLDNGPGIPEGLLERIYDPFYSTSPQGTGLGLFIARELCTLNGLSLRYRRRKSGGSEFYILFLKSQPAVTLR